MEGVEGWFSRSVTLRTEVSLWCSPCSAPSKDDRWVRARRALGRTSPRSPADPRHTAGGIRAKARRPGRQRLVGAGLRPAIVGWLRGGSLPALLDSGHDYLADDHRQDRSDDTLHGCNLHRSPADNAKTTNRAITAWMAPIQRAGSRRKIIQAPRLVALRGTFSSHNERKSGQDDTARNSLKPKWRPVTLPGRSVIVWRGQRKRGSNSRSRPV